MSGLTCRSTWISPIDGTNDVQLSPDTNSDVTSFTLLPLQLIRPASDATIPCQLLLHWSPKPLRCLQLQLKAQCSARHVELYAEGMRQTMLGEEKQSEVYLGTFRGTRLTPEAQHFTINLLFKQNHRDCEVLKSLQTLKIKFVSLSGDKNMLNLQLLQCEFLLMDPILTDTSSLGLAASMAKVNLKENSNVQEVLNEFRQTLEREMEAKIALAIDLKLSTLSQRLALSEQALVHLHKKMDAKDANLEAKFTQIQQSFRELEGRARWCNIWSRENMTPFDDDCTRNVWSGGEIARGITSSKKSNSWAASSTIVPHTGPDRSSRKYWSAIFNARKRYCRDEKNEHKSTHQVG
ncbi:uncharacterized protein PHALS_08802 [Plasmopara halstedii]|uniref:Uncharacterized protein n=1 Tax=Plasmopara halstedii TaxID=4781 RepID=A0A0P1ADA2_PLAHL|nr:uncharacterized protein PHALS_08802 [Plasmopara halstedii]CEG38748.1 hypothetical protein PHALS_08802 [Plasmopara halstedii]|eukprot:XP_024575117.1 hypothetical protein PHALS_08802 [Plasmopara halstedii]